MDLFDLEVGNLFFWNKRPQDIYKLVREDDGNGRSMAICVFGQTVEGQWKETSSRLPEFFNSYAEITKVIVSITFTPIK